jgi:ribosomal protein L18E
VKNTKRSIQHIKRYLRQVRKGIWRQYAYLLEIEREKRHDIRISKAQGTV